MFELVFFGTSAAAPSIHRGLTSQMLIANEYRFLIDCGEGTQRQILQSGLGFKKLNRIMVTHSHLDHILGLGGLISTLTRWESLDEIDIWAGEATMERIKNLLFGVVLIGQRPPIPVNMNLVYPGVIFEDRHFTISAFPVRHQGENYGYVFEERPYRPFLEEKAQALSIPFGPERGRLVAGETVTLSDGRIIQPEQVVGDAVPGAKYVHVGDCGSVDNLYEIAAGADCLVIEATYIDEEIEMARKFGHLTAGDSARFAKEAGVKTLILTHISRRNREIDVIREAQSIFPDTYVARDFDHFEIHRDRAVTKLSEGTS
jgi:ribonuclease Z